jgi:hypothetical protein
MTPTAGGWRDSEQVRAALRALSEADDEYYHHLPPWGEPMNGERDYELTTKYTVALHAALDAVWASAVRGRAEELPSPTRFEVIERDGYWHPEHTTIKCALDRAARSPSGPPQEEK